MDDGYRHMPGLPEGVRVKRVFGSEQCMTIVSLPEGMLIVGPIDMTEAEIAEAIGEHRGEAT